MSTIAIVGDVHLGKGVVIGKPGIGNSFNSRIVDQLNLLNYVLDKSIEHNVEAIIFTGDIFDGIHPDYRIVSSFIEYLKTCEYNGIETHIIVGNHDVKRSGTIITSVLDIISAAEVPTFIYKNITNIHFDGIGITLVPFKDRNFLNCNTNDEAIEKIKSQLEYHSALISDDDDKLLIGHLAIDGAIYVGDEYDNKSSELMCPLDMFNDYDHVWMGHIHKPQVLEQSPYIAHVGSLDISDFGEVDHKKHFIIYNSNTSSKFEFISLPTRTLRHISITIPLEISNSTKFVIEEIESYNKINFLKNAIVRIEVILPDANMDAIKRIDVEKYLYSLGVFYICSLSESRSVSVIPIDKQNLVSNKVVPKEAVKLFAERNIFDSENEKEAYITEACSVIDEYSMK